MRTPPPRALRRRSPGGKLLTHIALGSALLVATWAAVKLATTGREHAAKALFRPGFAFDDWLSTTYRIREDAYNPDWVWFATEEGLRLHSRANQTWKVFGLQDGLPSPQVSSLDFDARWVWLGTWKGLMRMDRASLKPDTVPGAGATFGERILDILSDQDYVWIATFGHGLLRYSKRDAKLERYTRADGLASDYVYSLAAGPGALYLGHDGGRVTCGLPGSWRALSPDGLRRVSKGTAVWDLLPQGPRLWAATSDAGVLLYDFAGKAWKQYLGDDGFLARGAYALAEQDGDVFAGTARGLFRFEPQAGQWLPLPEAEDQPLRQITALEPVSRPGRGGPALWYGAAGRGVGLCGTERVSWYEYAGGLAKEGAEALEPVGGLLWAGYGYKGGYLDLLDSGFTSIRNYNPWAGQRLENVGFLATVDSVVVAGGFTGCAYYRLRDPAPRWTAITTWEGGPMPGVNAAAAAGGTILLGTDAGAYSLDVRKNRLQSAAEIPKVYISSMCDLAGQLFVGTLRDGVLAFTSGGGAWKPAGALGGDSLDLVTAAAGDPASGRVWFGTRGQGVKYLDARPGGGYGPGDLRDLDQPGLRGQYVTALLREGGRLWIGTKERGVWILGPGGEWRYLHTGNFLQNDQVNALKLDSARVWIGDGAGITRIDRDSLEAILQAAREPWNPDT